MARLLPPRLPTQHQSSSTRSEGGVERPVKRVKASSSSGCSGSPIAASKRERHACQDGPASAAPSSSGSSRARRRVTRGSCEPPIEPRRKLGKAVRVIFELNVIADRGANRLLVLEYALGLENGLT